MTDARDVFVGDLDGDGRLDLAIATTCNDQPRFYRNLGGQGANWGGFEDKTASWEPQRPALPRCFTQLGVLVGQCTAAGQPDAACAAAGGSVCVDHGYEPAGLRVCGIAGGDIDADGDTDLYMVNYKDTCVFEDSASISRASNRDILLLNKIAGPDGVGRFVDETVDRLGAINATVSDFGTSAEIRDIDNDGDLDLIKLDTPGLVAFKNSGNTGNPATAYRFLDAAIDLRAKLPKQPPQNSDPTPYMFTSGHLNGDGFIDMFVVNDKQDGYLLGPLAGNAVGLTPVSPRTVDVGGNVKMADIDGIQGRDVGVADVDTVFEDSCNSCSESTSTCTDAGTISPPPSCTIVGQMPDHHACFEDNANVCENGLCNTRLSEAEGCSVGNQSADCQRRLFTLLRNDGSGNLADPWPDTGAPQNFQLNTFDFEFVDVNGDGCLDLFMGLCSGYKVFVRNCG